MLRKRQSLEGKGLIPRNEPCSHSRCKDENNKWSKLINTTNHRLQETVEMTNAKRNERDSDKGPEMPSAGWMTDALEIADGILAEGEGDLTKMGEFEDVEYKVSKMPWWNKGRTLTVRSIPCSARLILPFNTRGKHSASWMAYSLPLQSICEIGNEPDFPRRSLQAKARVPILLCCSLPPLPPSLSQRLQQQVLRQDKTQCPCYEHLLLPIRGRRTTKRSLQRPELRPCNRRQQFKTQPPFTSV